MNAVVLRSVHVEKETWPVDRLVGLVVKASASRAEDPGVTARGVVQRRDRQKKEFHDQSDYR